MRLRRTVRAARCWSPQRATSMSAARSRRAAIGTGAGGQIVTKAAGDDAIGSMAFVSAAGGASGGKGGFIEVSGKQVGLHGTIDPGKGGSLLIDPTNITCVCRDTTGGPVGTHIGSDFIENQLLHGINVTLDACHNVNVPGAGG